MSVCDRLTRRADKTLRMSGTEWNEEDMRRAMPTDNVSLTGDAPDIPPALTADEWDRNEYARPREHVCLSISPQGELAIHHAHGGCSTRDVSHLAALIALANAALNDEDPRRVRHSHITALREAASDIAEQVADDHTLVESGDVALRDRGDLLHELADALESYLPPLTKSDAR